MSGSKKATFNKNTKVTSKWLNNAMKSIGLSTKEYLTNVYPNIAEVSNATAKGSKNMITALRQNKATMNKITESLKQNKYVQTANKAFNNALSDLKTGKNEKEIEFVDFISVYLRGFEHEYATQTFLGGLKLILEFYGILLIAMFIFTYLINPTIKFEVRARLMIYDSLIFFFIFSSK